MFKEELLQFIWRYSFIDKIDSLRTTAGEKVQIISPGKLNRNAGPDFLEAKVKIGNTLWAGNVELHIKASDWIKHQHGKNENYARLILHVVYEEDIALAIDCPTLVLKNHIKPSLLAHYQCLMELNTIIPCERNINKVKKITIDQMYDRVLVERLHQKSERINVALRKYKNDWNEVFYIQLFSSFGLKINQDAFEKIATQTPFKVLYKHRTNLFQLEAILFGQAGMLTPIKQADEYTLQLQKEYNYLQKLYQLKPIKAFEVKYLRLRPANFPSVRIAQFAALLHQTEHLFSHIVKARTVKEIKNIFQASCSPYWKNHYRLSIEAKRAAQKKLSDSFIELISINTIIPILFQYGQFQSEEKIKEKSIQFLNELKAEKNIITKTMVSIGFENTSAYSSQAILHLKKYYCDEKRCLSCSIGYALLKAMDK